MENAEGEGEDFISPVGEMGRRKLNGCHKTRLSEIANAIFALRRRKKSRGTEIVTNIHIEQDYCITDNRSYGKLMQNLMIVFNLVYEN